LAVSSTRAAKGSLTAARLLILLYLWAFPLLGPLQREALHHAHEPECAGFAQEHGSLYAHAGPLVTNLHAPSAETHCAVCAFARSATLAQQTAVSTVLGRPILARIPPSTLLPHARLVAGSLGSRAPPVA
jgi:hypothetical protein